ncbi:hypothetical protein F0L74_29465 [Chitinophaga agrisoli]|uniref:Fibronectin type-III domain-containing protein n=1 Tax=Chitinophaga agrisoli TaxID=2607653 RepID=A0A5B2VNE1_9BACT|nr:DUF4998 domain-containing protein [Chitinophaga agrisoli]KAA2240294.1 hypothetical protein F0L74_29465 [Chitinophaga agrisoli]
MRIKYIHIKGLCMLAIVLLFLACSKKATDYRDLLGDKEIQYPGAVSNVTVLPGKGRLMLMWQPSPDPSVTRYVVYWNNSADSVTISADKHQPTDTVKSIITGLNEYTYTFFIYSYDAEGNKSVVKEVDNAHVYGSIYQNSLHNRLPDAATPFKVNDDGSAVLYFTTPDTINTTTDIHYTNAGGIASVISLQADAAFVTLPSYKPGGVISYQSAYLPVMGSLDTFYTVQPDTFPNIFKLVECDKGLFQEADLPHDMGLLQSDTRVSKLWDGSVGPQGYPNIYHNNSSGTPGTFSFDLGKLYNNLGVIEETGRNCCHNPAEFEVWGIADNTDAAPDLNANDPNFKSAMQAKGWTLLTTAVRGDDGNAPMKFNFMDNPPPVRYIRIRVLRTVDNSNDINLSELSFWNKE